MVVLLVAMSALAQTPTPTPVPLPTNTTMIITLLAVLSGYLAQAINTGSLFGVITVPKPWLPYLTLFGLALAAFVTSMSSGGTLFASIVAALMSLTGTSVGVTVHQHLTANRDDVAKAASKVLGVFLLLFLSVGNSACTNGQLNPTVVSVTVGGLKLLACGMNVYVGDTQTAPINWVQMAIDMGNDCGMDVADIISVFGADSNVAQAATANAAVVHAAAQNYKSAKPAVH